MNIEMIEKMILSGLDGDNKSTQYAKGFGRSLAIIWGMTIRMSQQEKDEFLTRLINHS